jgi:type IV pilus assembly protein PilV
MDMKATQSHSRGFTMVEMLVALVVLSIGMLGIAGLFAVSLRSGSSAIQRMQAVNLASEMADRIRANRRAGIAYTAAAADTGTNNTCSGAAAVVCTPAQLAANDIFFWKAGITSAFKGGQATGAIGYTAGDLPTLPSTYSITVSWVEQAQATSETSSSQSVVMQMQMPTN